MTPALKNHSAPPARPSSRRERRAVRGSATIRHLVMPGLEVARAEARKRETVTAFLRRTGWATRDPRYGWQFRKGLPTILEIDGEAVLRKFGAGGVSVRARMFALSPIRSAVETTA
jgi:hypothetical protein